MSRLRVHTFSVSIDGFGAGTGQDLEHPLGLGGPELFDWFFHTRTFQRMRGSGEGETGLDEDVSARGFDGIGAWILGRNMFGPVRGPWPDESWRGWWGEEPPYQTPVFVLPRPVQGQRPTGNQAAYLPDSRSESAVACSQIHGELLKLGIDIGERSVFRLLPPRPRKPPSQIWRTFLDNHLGSLASIDFFTVPTARKLVACPTRSCSRAITPSIAPSARGSPRLRASDDWVAKHRHSHRNA